MDVFLSFGSALEFYRSRCSLDAPGNLPSRSGVPEKTTVTAGGLKLLRKSSRILGTLSQPFHLLVSDADHRRNLQSVTTHVWDGRRYRNEFIQVENNVFVASPALCFLQMASTHSLEELIGLGFELMGTYAINENEEHGFFPRPEPLVSPHHLQTFIDGHPQFPNVKKARRALKYIIEGSASPMETAFAMLLFLPPLLGGYGIPQPTLNARVDVNKNAKKAANKNFYKCDLLWPAIKLAVEYDSDDFHTGSDAITADAKKRNALLTMGYKVVTITALQVMDSSALDKAVVPITKLLGKRLRPISDDQEAKRIGLRRTLLSFSKVSSYMEALYAAADREAGTRAVGEDESNSQR